MSKALLNDANVNVHADDSMTYAEGVGGDGEIGGGGDGCSSGGLLGSGKVDKDSGVGHSRSGAHV